MKKYLLFGLIFVCCFSFSSAQAPSWLWAQASSGNIYILSFTGDTKGNSYYTGSFQGGSVTFGGYTLTNTGNRDVFLVKYDPNGNVLWAKGEGGDNIDIGEGVATDTAGNVYVCGNFLSSTITFGSITLVNDGYTGNGVGDLFLVKYDANGNVLWAKKSNGGCGNFLNSMATDTRGNAYVAGYFNSSSITYGSITLNNTSGQNMLLVKYDPNGNVIWAQTTTASGYNNLNSVSTDSKGNVYVAGSDYSPTLTIGSYTLTLSGSTDVYAVKYDSNGNVRWAKNFGGGGGGAQTVPGYTTVDNNGNFYIDGYVSASSVSFGSSTITNGGGYNYFIAKYDSSGNPKWAQSGGDGVAQGQGMAVDANNNVYAAGLYQASSIILGPDTLYNNSVPGSQGFIAKYDSSGNVLWTYKVGGYGTGVGASDDVAGVAINNGNIYIGGEYGSDTITLGNFILTNTAAGTYNGYVAKLSTCGLMVNTGTTTSNCSQATGTATSVPSNGTAPYNYHWTNGSTLSSADSLSSGVYIVTVTDNAGCVASGAANVKDAGAATITVNSVNNVTCNGANTGSINISVSGGIPPYTYYWDNGSTNQNISNLAAGPYQINVTDSNGCMVTQVINISQPPAFAIGIVTSSTPCSVSTGIAQATVSGGTGVYTYLWTPSGQTSYMTNSTLSAGSYTVMVTDQAGCKDSAIADIENNGGPLVTITNINDASCFSNKNGTVNISITGGTMPYTYLWSNNSTDSTLTAPAGYYNIVVTDNVGCMGVTSAGINDTLPEAISICEVTVDTSERNQVIWVRSSENKIAYYNIYRETTSNGIYRLAASVPYDSTNIWTDPIAVAQSRSYRYKVSEVDSCSNESTPSDDARTIHLSVDAQTSAGSYKLVWDDNYEGVDFTKYIIYRDTIYGKFTPIDSVPNNGTQTYTDYFTHNGVVYYHVGINIPNPCSLSSHRPEQGNYNSSHSNGTKKYITGALAVNTIKTGNAGLIIYPNPSTGIFTLALQNVNEPAQVEIYNVLGEKVYATLETFNSQLSINLSNQPEGLYLYRVITRDGALIGNGKVVIQK